jgi:hypothetical protein
MFYPKEPKCCKEVDHSGIIWLEKDQYSLGEPEDFKTGWAMNVITSCDTPFFKNVLYCPYCGEKLKETYDE